MLGELPLGSFLALFCMGLDTWLTGAWDMWHFRRANFAGKPSCPGTREP